MKKSTVLKLLSTVSFVAAGLFSLVSVSSHKKVEKSEPVQVQAESWTQNPTIWFCPHHNWVLEGNERFKMNYYDNNDWKGDVEMTYWGTSTVPGPYYNRKVYRGVVSNGTYVSRIQICRMSPAYEQYNYSGQIYLLAGNSDPMLMMDEDVNYWNDWTTASNGVWFTQVKQHAVYKTTDQRASSSTGRVFFYNSGTHWASAAGCAVYAWGGSASPKIWSNQTINADATIYNINWFTDDNGESYGYADIPTNVTGYKFCTITDVNAYVTGIGYFSDTEFIPDSFAYVRYGAAQGNAISTGGAHSDVAGANLMKKVIQAYDTCSSSYLNGYGAYNALNTNFYSHATSAAKSATESSLNGTSATIQTHFEAMAHRSVYGLPSSQNILVFTNAKNIPTYGVIIVITVVAVSSIGGYFFVRKRKENN